MLHCVFLAFVFIVAKLRGRGGGQGEMVCEG